MRRDVIGCTMLFAALLATTSVSAYDFESDGIYYDITDAVSCEVEVTYDGTACYSGDVVIPVSVTYDGIDYSVTSIGSVAMYGCTSLTSVTFSEGLKSIGTSAFASCTSLTSIALPNSLETLGTNAFASCTSLVTATIGTGLTEISGGAFRACTRLESVEIPDNITSIGGYAFESTALKEISLGDNVTFVDTYAFAFCGSLAQVTMSNISEIGNYAFYDSKGVQNVDITGSGDGNIGTYCFDGCNSLETLKLSGIDTIKTYAFYECIKLSEVSLGENIKYIGSGAFCRDSAITELTLPESLEYVVGRAFMECKGLKTLTIHGNGSTVLASNAFNVCTRLKTVTFCEGVSKIKSAFLGCDSIADVYVQIATPPTKEIGCFTDYVLATATLHVPQGTAETYASTNYWSKFANIVDDIDEATSISSLLADSNEATIYAADGSIVVKNAGGTVEIYSTSGRLVYRGGGGRVYLPGKGIYIVKTAKSATKVAL